jgi:di/tricarboxylate transporter
MQKIIEFILYLLYNYYNDDNWGDVAYQVSIIAFLGLLLLNIFSVLVLFDLMQYFPISPTEPKLIQYIKMSVIILLPGYILLSKIFKKNRIRKLTYSETKIHYGNIFLIIYFLCSVVTLIVVINTK